MKQPSSSLKRALIAALHLLNATLAYIAWSLLFRVHIIGVRAFLGIQRMPFLMPHSSCVVGQSPLLRQPCIKVIVLCAGVYLVGITTCFLASVCVYAYGYNKFYLSMMARTHSLGKAPGASNGLKRQNSIEQSMTRSVIQANAASHLCCEGCVIH